MALQGCLYQRHPCGWITSSVEKEEQLSDTTELRIPIGLEGTGKAWQEIITIL